MKIITTYMTSDGGTYSTLDEAEAAQRMLVIRRMRSLFYAWGLIPGGALAGMSNQRLFMVGTAMHKEPDKYLELLNLLVDAVDGLRIQEQR